MMFKPVIKWSGSKRSQSEAIRQFLPDNFETYFEPFLGGGSMLYAIQPRTAVCGDICQPLIDLWNRIKTEPDELARSYNEMWTRLQNEGHQVYSEIRDRFNAEKTPDELLFLSRTCVNGLIRFNSKGDFNNSLHYSRPGIRPEALRKIIYDWSERIQNVDFLSADYRITTDAAGRGDLVYLDPPYFHTKGRYYGTIDYDAFFEYLESLNRRGVRYMLSFDGIRGGDEFTADVPRELYRRHEFIKSGNASFKKLMDKENVPVFESLYLNW